METNPKGCFLGGKGGRSLVVFQGKKVGFFNFPRNYSFCVGSSVLKKWMHVCFFLFFL
jgi:hypothetical protein